MSASAASPEDVAPQRALGVLGILGVLGVLSALLSPLLDPSGRPGPLVHVGEPCDYAVQVDGLLRCGQDAPKHLAELCPGRGLPQVPLRSGDTVRRALCRRSPHGPNPFNASRMDPEDLASLALPVDINAASEGELASLPGIGPVLAARISAARPFADTVDLLRVRGIGPVKLRAIEPRARIERPDEPAGLPAPDPPTTLR